MNRSKRRRNRSESRGLSAIVSFIDRNQTLERTMLELGQSSFRLGDLIAPRQTAATEYSSLESAILDALESAGAIQRVGADVWVPSLDGYLDDTSPVRIDVLETYNDPAAMYRGSAYVFRATIPEDATIA